MATQARTSIQDDLAKIRAAAGTPVPDRSIHDDLADIRAQTQMPKIAALTPPAIAPDVTRTGPDLRRGTHEAGFWERIALGTMGLLTHPQQLVTAPVHAAATAARFIGQSAAETTLPADIRAQALADPERISEEDAALAGLQLAVPTLPATGIIGRAVTGAATGTVYSPEDPAVGAFIGGVGGAAHAAIAREGLAPGVRILRPSVAPPVTPEPVGVDRQLVSGNRPPSATARMTDEVPPSPGGAPGRTGPPVEDAEVVPEVPVPQKLLPRLRTPAPEEPAAPVRTPAPAAPEVPAIPVENQLHSAGSIEADLAEIRKVPTPPMVTGPVPRNLTKLPIEDLSQHYRRVVDALQEKAALNAHEEDPRWRQMEDLPDAERTGVYRMTDDERVAWAANNPGKKVPKLRRTEDLPTGDDTYDADELAKLRAMSKAGNKAALTMAAQEKLVTRIESELTRRGVEHAETYFMADQAATGAGVGEAAKPYGGITSEQREQFLARRHGPPDLAPAMRHLKPPMPSVVAPVQGPLLNRAEIDRRTEAGEPGVVSEPVTAYHGTPHKFEKFSLEHVGSGEGHQSYGHGLYFAGKKEVAAHYREALSRGNAIPDDLLAQYFKPGRIVPSYGGYDRVEEFYPGGVPGASGWSVRVRSVRPTDKEARTPENRESGKGWVASYGERERVHSTSPEWREVEAVLGKQKRGSLFHVGLPDDQHMMDWDKPMSEQPPAVRKALESLAGRVPMIGRWMKAGTWEGAKSLTGEKVYHQLLDHFEDGWKAGDKPADQQASEALREAGIPGHRYLDAGSRPLTDPWVVTNYDTDGHRINSFRWATEREANEHAAKLRKTKGGDVNHYDRTEVTRTPDPKQTHNYVIYDDKHIEVKGVEERRVDRAQMELFKTGAINPETDRITFGSKKEREVLVARVRKEAGPMVETEPALPSSAQRIRAIGQKQRAWVDIRGQKVTTLEKLHQLLAPFRDPKTEQIGTVLVDDKGKIVSHTLETSGALNYVSAGDVPKWVHTMAARAKRLGVTKVMLHHNHPSGDPTPSPDDRAFTIIIANYLQSKGLTLVGHYVIDHTRGTWLEAETGTKSGEKPSRGGLVNERSVQAPNTALGKDWSDYTGEQLLPETLHQLARAAEAKDSLLVAYVDAQHRLIALEPHDKAKIMDIEKWIGQRLRAHGASTSVLLIPDSKHWGDDPRAEARRISQTTGVGRGIADIGVVSYDKDGIPRVESLRKAGVYETPGSIFERMTLAGEHRLPHRLFEQEPEYGRKKEFEEARKAGIRSGLTADQANAYAAAAKDIDFDGAKAVAQAKLEAGGLRTKLRRWADAAADQTRAIDRLSRVAVERGMPPERAPEYELALSYNSDDTIRRALYEAPEMATTHGILDPITREPMGPTLESVVKPLGRNPEKVRQAFTYVVALRKVGRGLKATAGDEGELNAAIAAVDALGKIPMYRQFSTDLEAHLDGIGRYAVRSGLWTDEQWQQLKHSDLFYIPFRRLMTHIEPPPGKKTYGTKRANVSTGIESFEGSRRFLANPVEAVAGYDARIIRRADAYRVGSAVIDALTQYMGEEGKAILTPLSEDSPEVKAFAAAAVRQNLARSGLNVAEIGMVSDLSAPMIDPHNPVVWRHSKIGSGREYFLLNEPELYKALVATRADSPLGTGALMTAFRLARRLMTVTATGINPRFALGLNIARDVPMAVMQNKGMRPVDIAAAALEAIKAVVGRSEFADLMARHGLGSASIYAHAVNAESAARKLAPVTQLQRITSRFGGIAGKPLEIAERIGAASDLVGRLSASRAAQRKALKAGRTPRGAAAVGATVGIRATVNFNRRAGIPVMQFLEQSVPFFGATVRSLARAGESVSEVPGRVTAAVVLLALATIAEWAYSRRDKEKRAAQVDRPATERVRFLQFGNVRYPLPQEMAAVVAGMRVALAQISKDDPDAGQQLAEALYNLLPPFASDLAQGDVVAPWPGWREIQEVGRNRQAYGQRPIVPERLQDLPPALRRNESTPPTFDVLAQGARKFAVLIPTLSESSPLEAEHLVRGFLGNMTPLLTAVTDAMIVHTDAGKQLPVTVPLPATASPLNPASAFIVRNPPSRTQTETWFYAKEKEMNQGFQAGKVLRKMEDQAETPAGQLRVLGTKKLMGGNAWSLSEDAADDVRVTFRETANRLKEYRQSEAEIRQRVNDGRLDPKLARPLLDALTTERQSMLRGARAVLMKMGVPK